MTDDEIDFFVRRGTTELMLTLYKLGYRKVHVGGMMRLLGVDDDYAAEHDHERVSIDAEFAKYLQMLVDGLDKPDHDGHVLH